MKQWQGERKREREREKGGDRAGRIASEAYVAIVERQHAISDRLGEAIASNAGKGENHFSAFVWPDAQRQRQASAFVPSDATRGCNMARFMHARARARIDGVVPRCQTCIAVERQKREWKLRFPSSKDRRNPAAPPLRNDYRVCICCDMARR